MREGWTYKKLGEVCKVVMGQSPDGNSVNTSNGIEFHQGKVFFGEKFLNFSNTYTVQPSKIALPNSVLLCVRAPVGIVNITPRKICIGRGLCAIQPKDCICMPFLFYALTQKQAYFDKNSTGSTFKAISSKVVANTDIPVPPLSEQQRIVSELDLLSSIIEKKKAQLKEYDQLAQSIFYDMFGDPLTNEKGWEVKRLGDISKIGTGATPSREKEELYYGGDIHWVKTTEVHNCEITNTEETITQLAIEETNCKIYPPNTLLMAMYGQGKTRGQIAKLKISAATNQACAAIMLDEKVSNLDFIYTLLLVKYEDIRAMAQGGNQANLNMKLVGSIPIIIPSLELQNQFASKIEAIERQKSLIQQSITEVETLFNSRMDYYFN